MTDPQDSPVIDIEFGLNQLMGNQALLHKMYKKFSDDFQDSGTKIVDFLKQGDIEQARLIAHTIKGVAGNLGLQLLHTTSTQFEAGLKVNTILEKEYELFQDALKQTFEEIDNLISDDNEKDVAPISSNNEVETHISTMEKAVNDNEFIDEEHLQKFESAVCGFAPKAALSSFKDAVENFDYEQANQYLQEIISSR